MATSKSTGTKAPAKKAPVKSKVDSSLPPYFNGARKGKTKSVPLSDEIYNNALNNIASEVATKVFGKLEAMAEASSNYTKVAAAEERGYAQESVIKDPSPPMSPAMSNTSDTYFNTIINKLIKSINNRLNSNVVISNSLEKFSGSPITIEPVKFDDNAPKKGQLEMLLNYSEYLDDIVAIQANVIQDLF